MRLVHRRFPKVYNVVWRPNVQQAPLASVAQWLERRTRTTVLPMRRFAVRFRAEAFFFGFIDFEFCESRVVFSTLFSRLSSPTPPFHSLFDFAMSSVPPSLFHRFTTVPYHVTTSPTPSDITVLINTSPHPQRPRHCRLYAITRRLFHLLRLFVPLFPFRLSWLNICNQFAADLFVLVD